MEFNPDENKLFEDDMISALGGLETILTTWLIDDGYDFATAGAKNDLLLHDYTAHYIRETGTLYLINTGFDTPALKDLLNKIGKGELAVNTIVVFPYSFIFEQMRELKTNIKTNLDDPPEILERY